MKVSPEFGNYEKTLGGNSGSGVTVSKDTASLTAYKKQKEQANRLDRLDSSVESIQRIVKDLSINVNEISRLVISMNEKMANK